MYIYIYIYVYIYIYRVNRPLSLQVFLFNRVTPKSFRLAPYPLIYI